MNQREMDTRFYAGLLDLLHRRIALLIARERRDRMSGPAFDPHRGPESGGGRTCSKCRRIVRYDVRVCPSCGTIAR